MQFMYMQRLSVRRSHAVALSPCTGISMHVYCIYMIYVSVFQFGKVTPFSLIFFLFFCAAFFAKFNLWTFNKVIHNHWMTTKLSDRLGMGAKFGHSFGLTTCGRPQLKLLLLLLFNDLGLRPISGAGHRKLQPNLAPTPYASRNVV